MIESKIVVRCHELMLENEKKDNKLDPQVARLDQFGRKARIIFPSGVAKKCVDTKMRQTPNAL